MGEADSGFSSPAAFTLPRMLGRRMLLKLVARGGMGDVYLAATTGIEGAERPCIVKTVRRDHIHDGSFLARFLDEARVQAQLQHPGVAQMLEAGTDDDGEPFTVVEYVEGRSLSDVRQRAVQVGVAIGWADAVAIAIEIAQALAHVHERAGADGGPLGIVHRDLSPQNLMIGYSGDVKLIDFGTARGHNRRCHTVAGVVFAKPGYVAPEVARQEVGDARIDLYALGVILWEMCAGRRFLTGDPQRHLEDAARGALIMPALAADRGAPRELDAVIALLTTNDPDERCSRAAIAVTALGKVLGMAPSPSASGPADRGVRARIATVMRKLWPKEPGRSRAEFARLLGQARESLHRTSTGASTPHAPSVDSLASRMSPPDPSQLAGTPYRLGRVLGQGASGVVYEAEHVELGRKVAVKVLGPEHAASPAGLERFRHEARAVARLSHPNLVQLYDFGKSLDGRVFLAMELCAGETLDVRLEREGGFGWREAVRIAIEAARALEAAHAADLVHRDLKPQNLMLSPPPGADDGATPIVKLLDFGIATAFAAGPSDVEAASGAGGASAHGFAVFGTPEYMAPEQVAGEAIDGRADVYALGCVLYEMLTGTRAFEGSSNVVVMGKQLHESPPAPRVRAPSRDIPLDVEAITLRAMVKSPAGRHPSASAMRAALEEALGAPGRRRTRVRRAMNGALTGAAMLVAAAGSAQWARTHWSALGPMTSVLGPSSTATAVALVAGPSPAAVTAPARPTPILALASMDQGAPITTGTTTAAPSLPLPAAALQAPIAFTTPPPSLHDARAAARAHPSDPRLLEAWARAAMRGGALSEARRASSAWSLHDGTVEPRVFFAQVLGASGRRTEARTVLEEWLESHPDSREARAELARLSGNASPAGGDGASHELAHR